jgi:RimJ/RimL family protein N-acetyltransferase
LPFFNETVANNHIIGLAIPQRSISRRLCGPVVRGKLQIENSMIQIRHLSTDDMAVIRNWAPYPSEFEDVDYALRNSGWLTEFRNKLETWCFAGEQSGELIAFTILSKTDKDEAEFRIAMRADKTGQGLGNAIANMTLAKGFSEIGLLRSISS